MLTVTRHRGTPAHVAGFTKLHGSIIHSSVWQTPYYVRVVWITMLAMADANGLVEASIGGLTKEAAVTREECLEALESFLGPDPDSKNKDFEGRRIEEVTGGWHVINHAQYRDRQTDAQIKAAERAKRYRQRRKEKLERDESREEDAASRVVTPVTDYLSEEEAEAEADENSEAINRSPSGQHPDTPAALALLNDARLALADRRSKKIRASKSKAVRSSISGRLNDGATLDDVRNVLGWLQWEDAEFAAGRRGWDPSDFLLGGVGVFGDEKFNKRADKGAPPSGNGSPGSEVPKKVADWYDEMEEADA